MVESLIETGVDKLVALANSKGRVSFKEAAKSLNVSMATIQEWADFLEEEGVVKIDYKFAVPYVVKKELTEKEIQVKAKDFKVKKDMIIRKAETILTSIDKEGEGFINLKNEFDKLKVDMEDDITHVKEELSEFDKYQEFKRNIDKQMLKDQQKFKEKLDVIHKEVIAKRAEYDIFLKNINKREHELNSEELKVDSMNESEEILKRKLKDIIVHAKAIGDSIETKNKKTEDLKDYVNHLKGFVKKIKADIEEKKAQIIEPLNDQSKEYEKKISELQKRVLDKVLRNNKEVNSHIRQSDVAVKKFKLFFDKKMKIEKLIDDVSADRDILRKEIIKLINAAKTFEIGLKSGKFKGHSVELEKKLREIDKKKLVFELALRRLGSFIKG